VVPVAIICFLNRFGFQNFFQLIFFTKSHLGLLLFFITSIFRKAKKSEEGTSNDSTKFWILFWIIENVLFNVTIGIIGFLAFLWIRKNLNVLHGSESEKKFVFGSRYCYKINKISKNQRLNTWKRTKWYRYRYRMFFL
jgi:hypothetical protein